MRAAAEAVMACCEFKALGELGDGGIIGVRVVEHKVSDLATCYTVTDSGRKKMKD
jgi:hypothetical protein